MAIFYSKLRKLIANIFPTESQGERFLRTQYHWLTAGKLYVAWQIRASRASYSKWVKLQQEKPGPEIPDLPALPAVSFLVPVGTKPLEQAVGTVKSIQGLYSNQWQVVLLAAGDLAEKENLAEVFGLTRQMVVVDGLAGGLEQALEVSTGRFIVCCTPGDEFSNDLLGHFYRAYGSTPAAQVYYYDSDEKEDSTAAPVPFFKPSQVSPELLLSADYLSNAIIDKESAQRVVHEVDSRLDFMHQARELLFLLTERNAGMKHIPQVLVHKIKLEDDSRQTEQVIQAHLSRAGSDHAVVETTGHGTRVSWASEQPAVSIIIPTRNNSKILKTLLDSIFSLTQYPDYEVVLVDNASDDPKTRSYYASLESDQRVRILSFDEPFNYSKVTNTGAANSKANLLLFLNNDMQVLQPDWLAELAQWAMLPEIGVVGAKLLRPNRTIQHAGVVIGLQGFMGHLYLNAPDHYYGLLGSVDWYRNVSAVTGACQMMRRSVFEELGGYDENFRLVFSDVDICLRAIQKGYRVLYDPFATLIHFEGHSRGYNTPLGDLVRGYEKLEDWLLHDDPYFSPNLTYVPIPFCRLEAIDDNSRASGIKARKNAIMDACRR